MDQRTRKLLTMHKTLHPRDNINRLYRSRTEKGRGPAGIEYRFDVSIWQLEKYIQKNKKRLITATSNCNDNTRTSSATITKKQKWEERQKYGHFKQQTGEISHKKTWTLLSKGNLKRETEYFLIAAQNNVITMLKQKSIICNRIAICNWHAWNGPQRLGKKTGRVRNRRTNRNHIDNSFVEIGQNKQKSPENLRKLTCSHPDLSEKPSANADVKNSQ